MKTAQELADILQRDPEATLLQGDILVADNLTSLFKDLPRECRQIFLEKLLHLAVCDIVPGGFRSYDIRIDAGKLPNHVACVIGLKAAGLLKGLTGVSPATFCKVGVGRAAPHARPSSERIQKAYMNGLALAGVEVLDLGVTTTPDVYFAAAFLKKDPLHAVVNISASHNPKKDNGIKHCIRDADDFIYSISAADMLDLKARILIPGPVKEKSDQEIREFLLQETLRIQAPVAFHEDPDQLSHLHHSFVILYACLGAELIAQLNSLHGGDYKKLLRGLGITLQTENPETKVKEMLLKPWEEVSKALGFKGPIAKPWSFGSDLFRDMVVVLDYGQGSAHRTAPVYEALGINVIPLAEERGFNPLEERNQCGLKEAVLHAAEQFPDKEVVGLSHDEDGDRLGVMRLDGVPVGGDRLLVLCAGSGDFSFDPERQVVTITEVKSRPETRAALEAGGVRALIVPTGFAFIKDAAIQLEKAWRARKNNQNAPAELTLYGQTVHLDKISPVMMWAELSGHFGLGHEVNYFFDDATLMGVHVLRVLKEAMNDGAPVGKALIGLDEANPSWPSSGELNVFVTTKDPEYVPTPDEKEELVEVFKEAFNLRTEVSRIDTTDGIQVFLQDTDENFSGWLLIRKSNNEDKLVMVTSAPDQTALDNLERLLWQISRRVSTKVIAGLVLTEADAQGDERHPDPYVERRLRMLGFSD